MTSEAITTIPRLEETFSKACKDGTLPGAVLVASNRDGTFNYARSFGPHTINPDVHSAPLRTDAIMWLASTTKLMTSIAALQCVENGLLSLDADIKGIWPELDAIVDRGILKNVTDDGKLMFQENKTPLTLRHLLTHTSGFTYDGMSSELLKVRAVRSEKPSQGTTIMQRFGLPMIFEPGTAWMYGPSVDFAGKLVEKVTNQTLEEYFAQKIWRPLGIKDITFWPQTHSDPQFSQRMMGHAIRDPEDPMSGRLSFYPKPRPGFKDSECFGGHGTYGSLVDYIKILQSLLRDDHRLLKSESIHELFRPQLPSNKVRKSLHEQISIPFYPGEYPEDVTLDHGLAGLLTLNSDEGRRTKGTLIWSGMYNLFWFVDREAGACGIFGTQIVMPSDRMANKMITAFEKAIYSKLSESKL